MVFPKKSHWNLIFLALSGKMIFFFPKIWSYSLDTKRKMICLKKNLEIWYFLQMFWKDSLSKKLAPEHDLFCNIWKDGFFFSRKYIFSLGGKWKKMIFIKKRVEIWYFLYICVGVRDVALPPWLKNEDAPKKYTSSVKGVISDDIHPRFILDSSYFCWNTTFIDA